MCSGEKKLKKKTCALGDATCRAVSGQRRAQRHVFHRRPIGGRVLITASSSSPPSNRCGRGSNDGASAGAWRAKGGAIRRRRAGERVESTVSGQSCDESRRGQSWRAITGSWYGRPARVGDGPPTAADRRAPGHGRRRAHRCAPGLGHYPSSSVTATAHTAATKRAACSA